MAGKTNLTATLFAQKKLLGKANTGVNKSDAQEVIPSNIQVAAQTIFAEDIPDNPAKTLYLLQSASAGLNATVEYVQFDINSISGTGYDANDYDSDASAQSAGFHAYSLFLSASYQSLSSNTKKGDGVFNNSKEVHTTLGALQLVPPNFSGQADNPYQLKLFDAGGSAIDLLDELDWSIDYYNGILFVQDVDAGKVPTTAKGFVYVGSMLSASLGNLGGGGGSGDITAVIAGTGLTGGANSGNATLNIDNSVVATLTGSEIKSSFVLSSDNSDLSNARVLTAGDGISISTANPRQVLVSNTGLVSRSKNYFEVTSSHPATNAFITSLKFLSQSYDENRIDVIVNGQYLRSGSSHDYYLQPTGSVIFNFDLEADDTIAIITF